MKLASEYGQSLSGTKEETFNISIKQIINIFSRRGFLRLHKDEDGKSYINIYSKANTDLGRFLSNFTQCRILTEDGWFNSVEGYWYYLGSGSPDKKKYRTLFGFEAKKVGKSDPNKVKINEATFQRKIKKAIAYKIGSQSHMAKSFMESTLPFVHYYDYKGKIVEVTDCDWIMDFLSNLRSFLKANPLTYINKSLFDAPNGATLGHSCNQLGTWGAGIALEFKNRFKEAYLHYQKECNKRSASLGDYTLFEDRGHLILSLFTSKSIGHKSCPPNLINERTFASLTKFTQENPETHLCLPKINSNLFKCQWEETEVSLRILKFFFPKLKLEIYLGDSK